MPSTYSSNLRIELIASGEQGNTWGNTTNNNLGTLIEQAISGYRSIDTIWSSNACTLTALNGANDQARNMFLDIPSSVLLTAEGQLVAPTVPKMYVIRNNTSGGYAIRIKTGASSTTCLIPNGATKAVVCDGTNFSEATTAAADFYIANTPTTALQATNKTYVDTADNLRLKLDGTQNMTGELVLSAGTAPSNALAAVSKQYVTNTFLPLAGGTLTGALTLPSVAPVGTWQAVPKTYVDAFAITASAPLTSTGTAGTGISMSIATATASARGVVKGGGNVSIAADGTMSVTGVGSGTVTSVGFTAANGFTGTVATATSTPNLTIGIATALNGSILKGATGGVTFATSADITTLIGANVYYPASNPNNYATQSYVAGQGYITSSGTVATATNATQLGGVSSTGYLRTNGSNGISNSGNDVYLSVESTSNMAPGGGGPSGIQSLRIGSHYEGALGYNVAYIGARSPSGNPAVLVFYRVEGSTYTVSGAFGQNGAFTVNQLSGSGTASLSVDNTGKLIISSDQNLKIEDGLLETALSTVEQLQPRYFYWKNEAGEKDMNNGRQLGFFAQEVNALSPEASATGTAINDRAIIAMLVKAVQELSAKVDALQGA